MFGDWTISGAVVSTARWATRGILRLTLPPIFSEVLVRLLALLSDSLSPAQQEHLRVIFRTATVQYIEGHVDIAGLVRGIAVVVADESEVEDFVNGVLATLSEDGFITPASLGSQVVQTKQPVDFSAFHVDLISYLDAKAVLIDSHHADENKILHLPKIVTLCIYESLQMQMARGGSCAAPSCSAPSTPQRSSSFALIRDAVISAESNMRDLTMIADFEDGREPASYSQVAVEPLQCSISFDDILDPRGRLMPDVSIIAEVSKSDRASDCKSELIKGCDALQNSSDCVHIFFFKTTALVRLIYHLNSKC